MTSTAAQAVAIARPEPHFSRIQSCSARMEPMANSLSQAGLPFAASGRQASSVFKPARLMAWPAGSRKSRWCQASREAGCCTGKPSRLSCTDCRSAFSPRPLKRPVASTTARAWMRSAPGAPSSSKVAVLPLNVSARTLQSWRRATPRADMTASSAASRRSPGTEVGMVGISNTGTPNPSSKAACTSLDRLKPSSAGTPTTRASPSSGWISPIVLSRISRFSRARARWAA